MIAIFLKKDSGIKSGTVHGQEHTTQNPKNPTTTSTRRTRLRALSQYVRSVQWSPEWGAPMVAIRRALPYRRLSTASDLVNVLSASMIVTFQLFNTPGGDRGGKELLWL
ncbi:hypothetical protein [Arthrobacter psychrolactophilus]|uniref:hypothetical protein n=1 Tax=Arthrobacter psychrolactophilus TaxID=92442 RepID=UPI0011B5DABE|nr:hypothetical protein [Arthrobacter psychrolactophilus]